jgi:hypothetical protein
VDKRNIKDINHILLALDTDVLSDLAKRLEAGEHIQPKNPSEHACYDLLNDLEIVGSHVQGSLASKKYMRNEIWSLIAFKGAPSWCITFSPVDKNHPPSVTTGRSDVRSTPTSNISSRLSILLNHLLAESILQNLPEIGSSSLPPKLVSQICARRSWANGLRWISNKCLGFNEI